MGWCLRIWPPLLLWCLQYWIRIFWIPLHLWCLQRICWIPLHHRCRPAVKTLEAAPAAYAPYTYGAYALPTATAQVSPSASLTTLGLADPSIPAVGGAYAGAGRYVANSAGVVHVA